MATYLITGAGSGFGREIALRLAAGGERVIAGVEVWGQVEPLRAEAAGRGVEIAVEKLDVTSEGDRRKAARWSADVLLNNAGTNEGGAVVDIPAENMRRQFEVNVIGPVLLTQGIVKDMIARGSRGRVVFMSSVVGLLSDPFSGAYCASKHAIEAVAGAMCTELKEFGIAVATINPGPFLTGFNDRGFDAWRSWLDDPARRLFDHEKLAAPFDQFDPEPVYDLGVSVLTGAVDAYRNVVPADMVPGVRDKMDARWTQKSTDGLGARAPEVEKAYAMRPGTPAPTP